MAPPPRPAPAWSDVPVTNSSTEIASESGSESASETSRWRGSFAHAQGWYPIASRTSTPFPAVRPGTRSMSVSCLAPTAPFLPIG